MNSWICSTTERRCPLIDWKSTKGSVLMEFVIVLPIYFLLLGFVFVVGELALHSIHLTAFIDRGMALSYRTEDMDNVGIKVLSTGDFVREIGRSLSLDKSRVEVDYSYEGSGAGDVRAHVSEITETDHVDVVPADKVDGHFLKAVAGNVTDNYTLTPLARGFAEYWFHETEHRVYDGELMSRSSVRLNQHAVDRMLKSGSLGRTPMHGNYRYDENGVKVRHFGYYSLQRNLASYPDANGENPPYRMWQAGALVQEDGGRRYWEHVKDGETDDYGETFATVRSGSDFIEPTDNNPGQRLEEDGGFVPDPVFHFSPLL